jgi:transposase
MIQLVPQLKILLACQPVDFRKGIDSLVALCKAQLAQDPFSGALFVFRNRSGTALKLLVYDGQGFWLCLCRFSQGRLRWWPRAQDTPLHPLEAQQLQVLLYHGWPDRAGFSDPWRKIEPATLPHAAARGGCDFFSGRRPAHVVPRQVGRRVLARRRSLAHQGQEIFPGVDPVEPAGLDQAHQDVTHRRPMFGLVEE